MDFSAFDGGKISTRFLLGLQEFSNVDYSQTNEIVCEFPQNPVIVGFQTPEDHQLRLEAGECFFRCLFVGIHERVEDLKASNLFS